MKIVVNRCFGGFSLSKEAVELFYKRKGKTAYHFKYQGNYTNRTYLPLKKYDSEWFSTSFDVPNPNDFDQDVLWKDHFLTNRPENRTDEDLIYVVEKLGEKANGSCASLEVIEIPDDVNWEIDDYDGNESIHEQHRRW